MNKQSPTKKRGLSRGRQPRSARTRVAIEPRRDIRLDVIGEIATTLGHESRNLLGALGTCAQVLQRNPHLAADDRELLDIMQSGANRLGEIIAQFAIFRRIRPPQIIDVAVRELIKETLNALRRDERCSARIAFQCNFDSAVDVIAADRERLRQAFWHLCLNAAQAMPNGGTLAIATQKIRYTVHISVRDSGAGIAPGHLKKIFEPLFTTKTRSTGLGLTIVREIVEQHGGRVKVRSETGQGACFTLELPKLAKPEPARRQRTVAVKRKPHDS